MLRSAGGRLLADPSALDDLTAEDAPLMVTGSSLDDVLAVVSAWVNQGLRSAEELYRDPPPDCLYEGFGLNCVALPKELSLGPYVWYKWRDQREGFGMHSLVIVRTGLSQYGLWGNTLEELAAWPELARQEDESDEG